MRGFDIALTALALGALRPRPPDHENLLVPAVDGPDAVWLYRTGVPLSRAALVSSLWPAPTHQCLAPPVFAQLAAPAMFGVLFRVSWPASAEPRVLQTRLREAFPATEEATTRDIARAA